MNKQIIEGHPYIYIFNAINMFLRILLSVFICRSIFLSVCFSVAIFSLLLSHPSLSLKKKKKCDKQFEEKYKVIVPATALIARREYRLQKHCNRPLACKLACKTKVCRHAAVTLCVACRQTHLRRWPIFKGNGCLSIFSQNLYRSHRR